MNKDWKFTWEVEIEGKLYTKEADKNFDSFIHLRPYLFKVKGIDNKQEFYFPVVIGQKRVFFRKAYGKCGVNHMVSQTIKIINCFGTESDDSKDKNIVWECDDKYYFVDDINNYVGLK